MVAFDLALIHCNQISQLLYLHERGQLVLIVAKVVDDLKAAGAGR